MLIITAFVTGYLFTGCKKQPGQSPSADDRSKEPGSQLTVTKQAQLSADEPATPARIVAANVLFSGPGLYQSSNKFLTVEIRRETADHVTYLLWRHLQAGMNSPKVSIGAAYPLREKELLMCWDDQGRLWTYHPIEFVHYHYANDAELIRVFVGSGSKVRDQMPVTFRESIPKNIQEVFDNAVANSPNGVLRIPLERKE